MVASLCKLSTSRPSRQTVTADSQVTIAHNTDRFSHADAEKMSQWAQDSSVAQTVVIDLGLAAEADTSAFARLVLLRRSLLRAGRDLSITGLRDRVAALYEVSRLETILPRMI